MADSYINGQCTDRYGIAMDATCEVCLLDHSSSPPSIVGYGTSVSGTGLFSVLASGIAVGGKVLAIYYYEGTYGDVSDLAGSEFMTTASGATVSGGGS